MYSSFLLESPWLGLFVEKWRTVWRKRIHRTKEWYGRCFSEM